MFYRLPSKLRPYRYAPETGVAVCITTSLAGTVQNNVNRMLYLGKALLDMEHLAVDPGLAWVTRKHSVVIPEFLFPGLCHHGKSATAVLSLSPTSQCIPRDT